MYVLHDEDMLVVNLNQSALLPKPNYTQGSN